MMLSSRPLIALIAAFSLAAAACGGSDDASGETGSDSGRPTVVVTTTILGDVVENLVGDEVDVVTIMPVGADPHDFQASAQQVAAIGEAEALIVNGGGFEEGLLDVIEAAEGDGVAVFEALAVVETIDVGEGGHDEHGDEDHADEDEHGDEDHADEDEHDEGEHDEGEHDDEGGDEHGHDGDDPHFWTDPARMAVAADGIAEFLVATVDGVDAEALRASADAYVAELESLDAEAEETLRAIASEDRIMVTNHDAFGYFADRFDFEVVGTVIPSGSTTDGASAQELAELTEVVEHEGVSAIFSESTVSDELANTLADEVGDDVAVVELFTGSLGESGSGAETYVAMVRTNAERVAEALAG